MNNRLEQLNVAYKKALGAIFLKEYSHLSGLTVTDFLIDPSTQTGRVFLATELETLVEIEKERGKIQNQLKKYLMTRYTPKLTFVLDDHYLEKIDELFRRIEIK